MFPTSTKDLLQDTKSVPDTPVPRSRRTIKLAVILFIFTLIGLSIISFQRIRQPKQPSQTIATALEASPVPLTNTFVDRVYGTVLFSRDSNVYTMNLPDRSLRVLLGIESDSSVTLHSSYPPVWSPDGRLVAIVNQDSKITVSEFDSGRYIGTFPLPANSSPSTVVFSLDPASEILSISQSSSSGVDESVRFFSLTTQKELGVYPRCSGTGVWMQGVGFSMMCTLGDTRSVVVIRFEPNSSVMTPLKRETATVKYQLIDEYRSSILLMKRTQGTHVDLVTLDANGKITIIPQSEYKAVPDIQKIVEASIALRQRIEKEAHTKPVLDVSVASDNSFLIFETVDGLYVAKLDLKEPAYYLGKGSLPRIRPN